LSDPSDPSDPSDRSDVTGIVILLGQRVGLGADDAANGGK
jgi:hypothetical protein